ncbi:MAG: hypothetical protein ACKOU7_01830 [Ferruginibacter sp.]
MNTRRKFLLNGSMASVALLTAKPFTALANTLAPVTGFSVNNNKVVLLHTGNYNPGSEYIAASEISRVKRNTGNLVLVHAGDHLQQDAGSLHFDSVLEPANCASVSSNNYKIIYKDKIKIGIITAAAGEKDVLTKTEALAVSLKQHKNCDLVICLSKLGYKKSNAIDDITMAENSTALDIIIGGHPANYTRFAVTARNRNRHEVIIHSAADTGFALGNIEIGFDDAGHKNAVAFNNLLTRITADS